MISFTIIGNGIHVQRYIDSLLFSQQNYLVSKKQDFHDLEKIKGSLVIAEPLLLETLDKIAIPAGIEAVYIEKLPFMSIKKLRLFMDSASHQKIRIIHTRLYETVNTVISGSVAAKNTIIWPNLYHQQMHPIWNTLPNALDWLVRQLNCSLDSVILLDTKTEYQIIEITVSALDREFLLCIVPSEYTDRVIFNDIALPWPNYMDMYDRAFCDKSGWPLEHTEREIQLVNTIEEQIRYEH